MLQMQPDPLPRPEHLRQRHERYAATYLLRSNIYDYALEAESADELRMLAKAFSDATALCRDLLSELPANNVVNLHSRASKAVM